MSSQPNFKQANFKQAHDDSQWLGTLIFALALLTTAFWTLWISVDPSRANHDVSWHQTLGAGLLDGARFGLDLTDVNPPWIFIAHGFATSLSRLVGVAPLIVWSWLCLVLHALALRLCRAPLRRLIPSGTAWIDVLLGSALIGVVAGSGYDFGQRDPLASVLLLPYACQLGLRHLHAKTGQGRDLGRLSARLSTLLIGLLAGLAVMLKAHYGLALLMGEAFIVWRLGVAGWAQRPTLHGMVIAAVAGLITLGTTGSDWLVTLPDLLGAYGGFSTQFNWVQPTTALVVTAVALAVALAIRPTSGPDSGGFRGLVAIFAGGSSLALGIAALQGKGYSYHNVPAQLWAIAALAVYATAALSDPRGEHGDVSQRQHQRRQHLRHVRLLGGAALLPWMLLVGGDRDSVPLRMDEIALSRAIGAQIAPKDGGSNDRGVFAFATSISPIFPAITFSGGRWLGREGHLWRMASLYRAAAAPGPLLYPSLQDMDTNERAWLTALGRHLKKERPRLIIVDASADHQGVARSGVELLRYFRLNADIASLLSDYHKVRQMTVTVGAEHYTLVFLLRRTPRLRRRE